MTEYSIETRKFNSGKIRTKYNADGKPVNLGQIGPQYRDLCGEFRTVQERRIREGTVEKIVTEFLTD